MVTHFLLWLKHVLISIISVNASKTHGFMVLFAWFMLLLFCFIFGIHLEFLFIFDLVFTCLCCIYFSLVSSFTLTEYIICCLSTLVFSFAELADCLSIQLIDGDGVFNFSCLEKLTWTIKLGECGLSYAVVSIMGQQSSGMVVTPHVFSLYWHIFTTNIVYTLFRGSVNSWLLIIFSC